MTARRFPTLDPLALAETRDALHQYAQMLGAYLKTCRPKRKHWWHASLRPSLRGLSTGVVHANISFELLLDLRAGELQGETATGERLAEPLRGQSGAELATRLQSFLIDAGVETSSAPPPSPGAGETFSGYSAQQADGLASALDSVSAAMALFRAGIRAETSPIQLWPHHFDLSMLWLPGGKIPSEDPADEEAADKQMNFGFTFGDAGIPEPYLYVTAYPLPAGLPRISLPAGTTWRTQPFNGAVLLYRTLENMDEPAAYLLDLWQTLLAAGEQQLGGYNSTEAKWN